MEMADRIVVMNKGVIEQVGSASDLYDRPANRFVAEFIGRMNVLRLDPDPDRRSGPGALRRLHSRREGPEIVGIRPEHVELADGQADTADVVVGTVEKVVYLGRITRIHLAVDGQDLLVDLRAKPPGLTQGSRLAVRIPSPAVHRFGEMAK
jgi:iron(III) transport system ATP-binding protein